MFKKENWVKQQLREDKKIQAIWTQPGSPTIVEAAKNLS